METGHVGGACNPSTYTVKQVCGQIGLHNQNKNKTKINKSKANEEVVSSEL